MANKTLIFGLVILCALAVNASVDNLQDEKPCKCMNKNNCPPGGVVDG